MKNKHDVVKVSDVWRYYFDFTYCKFNEWRIVRVNSYIQQLNRYTVAAVSTCNVKALNKSKCSINDMYLFTSNKLWKCHHRPLAIYEQLQEMLEETK